MSSKNVAMRTSAGSKTRSLSAILLAVVALCLGACATQELPQWAADCDFGDVRFSADFDGGKLDACRQVGDGYFILRFDPENAPINHSPWYSFQVSALTSRIIDVQLTYSLHSHRYWPKLSSNGKEWVAAASGAVTQLDNGSANLRLAVGEQALWVSGQELMDNQFYEDWSSELASRTDLSRQVIGQSVEGREVFKLETEPAMARYIVLTGRQHPPEVTGAISMLHFVERLHEPDDLATEFRRHYGMLIVPNMNPDGVAAGHWRHNASGVDLNRDWGPFTQPETRLLQQELARFGGEDSAKISLFLDFHSTRHDVLYTQLPEMPTQPENFTWNWIDRTQGAIVKQVPGYMVNVKPGHNPDRPTSKAYVHATFGVPAITFELGDETDRLVIERYSRVAAEQMMLELLESI